MFINHRAYHVHGGYLLQSADLPGFSRQDQAALAALVRTQRGRLSVTRVEELYPGRSLPILRLGVLLRLATGLHRSRPEKVGDVRLSAHGPHIDIALPEGYLDVRPLTSADLAREAAILEEAGFRLRASIYTGG